jgi:hypothetical protein
MFSWLASWFRKPADEEQYDLFRPKQRLIYRYFDGSKEVMVDPMILYKKVMEHGPVLSIDMKLSVSQHSDNRLGHTNLVKRIREIFAVKPLEEGGLSELETVQLLDHFLGFTERIKKNSSPSQTYSLNPEQSPPLNGHPMSVSSDSGSTEKESTTDRQESLPLG